MKSKIKAGSTSITDTVFCRDTSVTTKVSGLTGLAFNTSSLTLYYRREGASSDVAVTLVTATLGTWTSGGFVKLDDTNMPGQVEIHYPNAAIAAGAKYVTFALRGATNMEEIVWRVELDAVDYQDAVHFGLGALPNTNVTTNASLITSGTGTDQLSVASGRTDLGKWLGGTIPAVNVTGVPLVDLKYTLGTISPATAGSVRADAVTGAVGSVTGAVGSVTGNVGGSVGSVVGAVGSVTGNVGGNVIGSVGSIAAGGVSAASFAAAAITATVAPNLDAAITSRMATYSQPSGFLAATFPSGTIANQTNITAGTITTATNLTNAPTAGDFTAAMKTSLNAATPTVAVTIDAPTIALIQNGLATATALNFLATFEVNTAFPLLQQIGANQTNPVMLAPAQPNYAPAKAGDSMDMASIAGSVPAAANQKGAALSITRGTVGSASTTTSIVTSALTPAAVDVDQFKGLIVAFDANTVTPGLRNQKTNITGNSSGGVLTVTALTEAPVSGDVFGVY